MMPTPTGSNRHWQSMVGASWGVCCCNYFHRPARTTRGSARGAAWVCVPLLVCAGEPRAQLHPDSGAVLQYWTSCCACDVHRAAVAQLAARRSHNPKVVSSILTCRSWGTGVDANTDWQQLALAINGRCLLGVCCCNYFHRPARTTRGSVRGAAWVCVPLLVCTGEPRAQLHPDSGAVLQCWTSCCACDVHRAAVAQLAARRSHNLKVVSSILTCRSWGTGVDANSDWQQQALAINGR